MFVGFLLFSVTLDCPNFICEAAVSSYSKGQMESVDYRIHEFLVIFSPFVLISSHGVVLPLQKFIFIPVVFSLLGPMQRKSLLLCPSPISVCQLNSQRKSRVQSQLTSEVNMCKRLIKTLFLQFVSDVCCMFLCHSCQQLSQGIGRCL